MPIPSNMSFPSVGAIADESRARIAPNAPFRTAFAPMSPAVYDLDATVDGVRLKGTYLLPLINHIPVVPGAAGHITRDNGMTEAQYFRDANHAAATAGWTLVERAHLPDGVRPKNWTAAWPPPSHIYATPARYGDATGTFHALVWTSLDSDGDPSAQLRQSTDTAALGAWVAYLVGTRVILPAAEASRRTRIEDWTTQIADYAMQPDTVREAKVGDLERKIARWRGATLITPEWWDEQRTAGLRARAAK